MRKNTLKDKLEADQAVFGLMFTFPSPQLVEMLGYMGYDWVAIDTRHGSITLQDLEPMIIAAELSGLAPVVRVPGNRPDIITHALDRGAWGVLVPEVHNVDEAVAVVDTVKYFPMGRRGLFPQGRPALYGFSGTTKEYTEAANRETLVCLVIEDVETVERLEEMVKVDGVDGFFLGAGHLCGHMGYAGEPNHPEVLKVVERGVRVIRDAGKVAGVSYPEGLLPRFLEMGVRFFHGTATTLFRTAGQSYLQTMREAASKAGT